jgi:hypothetical protein
MTILLAVCVLASPLMLWSWGTGQLGGAVFFTSCLVWMTQAALETHSEPFLAAVLILLPIVWAPILVRIERERQRRVEQQRQRMANAQRDRAAAIAAAYARRDREATIAAAYARVAARKAAWAARKMPSHG